MSIIPKDAWYHDLVALIEREHPGETDRIGRPWYQHFERVALRLIFRLPDATKAQVQAALMHDALMAGGKGTGFLREIGLEERAIKIIALITPPPHGDYFRALEAITPEDNAIYFDYVERIVASGDTEALHVKLADFQDTCDLLNETQTPELKAQLRDRYMPARDRLLGLLAKPIQLQQ